MRAALLIAATAAAAASIPPQTRGLQGVDDDDMTTSLSADPTTLTLRYKNLDLDLAPGVRRYNYFWSNLEPRASTATVQVCPAGTVAIPASEADRLVRGYHRFHCYSNATLTRYDDVLARDAAIGAASAFIVSVAAARRRARRRRRRQRRCSRRAQPLHLYLLAPQVRLARLGTGKKLFRFSVASPAQLQARLPAVAAF